METMVIQRGKPLLLSPYLLPDTHEKSQYEDDMSPSEGHAHLFILLQ